MSRTTEEAYKTVINTNEKNAPVTTVRNLKATLFPKYIANYILHFLKKKNNSRKTLTLH